MITAFKVLKKERRSCTHLKAVSKCHIVCEVSPTFRGVITINCTVNTIKGGSRRAEKSRKVLMMMMKAAKLGWAGAGQEQDRSKAGAKQKRGRSMSRVGARQEQGRSKAGAGQEQS